MSKLVIDGSKRLYSIFLKLYPKKYTEEFGEEMQYVYSETLRDAYEEKGILGVIDFWERSVIDGVKSFLVQHIENQKGGGIIMQNKIFTYLVLGVGLVLMIPVILQFPWTLFDYIVMGILLLSMGSIFVLAARKFSNNRILVGIIVASIFLAIWVHLAVGIVDSWPLAGS